MTHEGSIGQDKLFTYVDEIVLLCICQNGPLHFTVTFGKELVVQCIRSGVTFQNRDK